MGRIEVISLTDILATVFGDDCLQSHSYDVDTSKQLAALVHTGTKSAHNISS